MSIKYLAQTNNFNLNIKKKKCTNVYKRKNKTESFYQYNSLNYCSMKYQIDLFYKFAKTLNDDTNNVKFAYKTKNKWMKQIIDRKTSQKLTFLR